MDEHPWPDRFARALSGTSGSDLALDDDEVEELLALARVVAHSTERRYAPLAAYLAGMFVSRRVAEGATRTGGLQEAVALAHTLL